MILNINNVKRELGMQPSDSSWNDSELNTVLMMYVGYVEDDIDGLCMRKMGLHSYVEKQKVGRLQGSVIRPANTPIQTVTQIRFLNGQTETAKYVLADNVYSFDEDAIYFSSSYGLGDYYSGYGSPIYVEITYTAGYTQYPAPLESLALKMVHWRYKQSMASKQGILGVSSTSESTFSSGSVSYTGLEKELEVCKNYIPMYA